VPGRSDSFKAFSSHGLQCRKSGAWFTNSWFFLQDNPATFVNHGARRRFGIDLTNYDPTRLFFEQPQLQTKEIE
jgi:hypothetical protein